MDTVKDLVLPIALVLLALAAIWLVVEVALTVRKARPVMASVKRTVDEVEPIVAQVGELVEQVKPVVARVDEVVAGAAPGVRQLAPVLEQTSDAIGALSGNLEQLDLILGDVSRISKTAGNATVAVGDAAGTLASRARTIFGRSRAARATVAPGAVAELAEVAEGGLPTEQPTVDGLDERPDHLEAYAVVSEDVGYFTYPDQR